MKKPSPGNRHEDIEKGTGEGISEIGYESESELCCTKPGCRRKPVASIRYSGEQLCEAHFSRFVEGRVSREIRRQLTGELRLKPVKGSEKNLIAAAVSGGKDSMTLLHILYKTFRKDRRVRIAVVHVDEGIEGYRPATTALVKKYCTELDLELAIISFKEEFGMTLDEMGRHLKAATLSDFTVSEVGIRPDKLDVHRPGGLSPCTWCGVLRRYCMNTGAKRLGARYLATGHNLDDCAQTALMNFMRSDFAKIMRSAPHTYIRSGLIPRILPLRMIPEKEVYLYALLNRLPFLESKCPYYAAAFRNEFRQTIFEHEMRTPGTRHSIIRSIDKFRWLLFLEAESEKDGAESNGKGWKEEFFFCPDCGEPSSSDVCKTCSLINKIRSVAKTLPGN